MRHYSCSVKFLERTFHPLQTHREVMRVNLDADAVATPKAGGRTRRSRPAKGIEHGIANKAEHAHKPLGELEREGGGMLTCRRSREASPDLLKPDFMACGGDDAQHSCRH